MASRIFVKGLPPTMSEADFRKHFAQNSRDVTDVKIFQNRRIGYVGYRTAEDAQSAVKYFNRTFIRMSKIGVEVARPVEDVRVGTGANRHPTARNDIPATAAASPSDNTLKRKRGDGNEDAEDPKLNEFLDVMRPKSKKKAWESEAVPDQTVSVAAGQDILASAAAVGESDDEYEQVPKKIKTTKIATVQLDPQTTSTPPADVETMEMTQASTPVEDAEQLEKPAVSDADWARSRTSRLLGLLDDEEEDETIDRRQAGSDDESNEEKIAPAKELPAVVAPPKDVTSIPTPPSDENGDENEHMDADIKAVRASKRLFVRNLPFDVKVEDLEETFAPYGAIEEVHVALDKKTGASKGFAYVQYSNPDSAEQALIEQDGQTFQGRLLHVLPATAKRETKMDEFELAKLPPKKQQQIKKRREAASSTFNWNALYMNADAVVSSVADRLGLSKSEVLDPTNSDAAIKQAHAETHIIQETKSYFKSQGVDLDAFKKSQRGDTAILIKNIPYDCSRDELKRLFEEHGDIRKFLMPPSGTLAIVEFANAAQCKAAFGALAYRKIKSSVLFLEKAPKDAFAGRPISDDASTSKDGVSKISTADLTGPDQIVMDTAGSATLFVRNLNFSTTTQLLIQTFKPLKGFLSARVKTKTDPKKPGQILSMGFGFLEFSGPKTAQAALQVMDGHSLEGHKLQIRASHKGADAAEERRKEDAAKRAAGQKTKVIVKNLPFEATKKDIQTLFGAYGQLRSVRVPKKIDRAARGFAFADFTTSKEAQNAIEALRDTHLLGRRLVLDFAAGDPEDAEAEIEKMQQKVGAQVNKVALQKLTSGGRKKFTTQDEEDDG